MSDWNTHLYCAHRVNEALQFQDKELEMFLYGNLLPDINMGWLIHPNVVMHQEDTHFDALGQEYFWAPLRLYEKYEKKIAEKHPLYLGYLFHLWLDVSYMTDFVSRIPMSQMIEKYHEVRQWKWKDGGLFIKRFHYTLSDEIFDDILAESAEIEEVKLTKDDLRQVVDLLKGNATEYDGKEYYLYTEDDLTAFYEKVCSDFIGWINRLHK